MNIAVLSSKGSIGKTIIASFLSELDKSMISGTEFNIEKDSSEKLISYLRENGRKFSSHEQLTVSDGLTESKSSIISSIIGCDVVLVVAEPTKSGFEDLMRVVSLCEHFGVFTMVCINKFDINEDMSNKMEKFVKSESLVLVGKIPYDDVTESINDLKSVIYHENSKTFSAIKEMWKNIKNCIY